MPNYITIRKVENHSDTETFVYQGPITIHKKDGTSVKCQINDFPFTDNYQYRSFSFVTENGNKISKSTDQYEIYNVTYTLQ